MNVDALKEEKWQHKGSVTVDAQSVMWWLHGSVVYLKQQVLSSGSYLLCQKQFKMNNE